MKNRRNNKRSKISTCCKRKKQERFFAIETIEFLKDKEISSILDLWCWEWLDSLLLHKAWYKITWVDISWVALDLFKVNIEKENITNIDIIEHDISNLNLKGLYDVVYANLSIQYFTYDQMKSISQKLFSYINKWGYLI